MPIVRFACGRGPCRPASVPSHRAKPHCPRSLGNACCFKRPTLSVSLVLFCALTLLAPVAPASQPATPPTSPAELSVEDFFRAPQLKAPQLNRTGTHLAMMVQDAKLDSRGLSIVDIKTGEAAGLRPSRELDIYSFSWAGDDRLVFSVSQDRRYAYGVYAIPRDRPDKITVVNRYDVVQILGIPRARPDNLLVWVRAAALAEEDNGTPEGLVELDLRQDSENIHMSNANLAAYIPPPPGENMIRWLRDRDGELRYIITHTGAKTRLFRRDGKQWVPTPVKLNQVRLLAVDRDPAVVFAARTSDTGQHEIVRLNTVDLSVSAPLLTSKRYSFDYAVPLFQHDEFVGVDLHREGPVQMWIDDAVAARKQRIDAMLPKGRINRIVDDKGDVVVIHSGTTRHPGEYFVVELTANRVRRIGNLAPWLQDRLLAPMHHATYRTRDGLQLDAYLTYPVGHDPKRPAPVIVLPHGGPWVRDSLDFDPEAQFYASRGYVVFQPNYRGSAGYDNSISERDAYAFRKMHDDVTDGVRMLIKYGVADPKRIAIVGTSFGGYLAVCGAAFEPELYRCAVTVAGVFDWQRLIRDWRNDASYTIALLRRRIGDPKSQSAKFAALSPMNAVGDIRIPVFVAHGDEDDIADIAQSRRLVKALAANRVPHETLFLKEVGHGIARVENRVELYTRIEAFLKKHL